MPHDRNGLELTRGAKVWIECTVLEIAPGEDYCNITVESVHGRKPDGAKERISAVNAAVMELAQYPKFFTGPEVVGELIHGEAIQPLPEFDEINAKIDKAIELSEKFKTEIIESFTEVVNHICGPSHEADVDFKPFVAADAPTQNSDEKKEETTSQ